MVDLHSVVVFFSLSLYDAMIQITNQKPKSFTIPYKRLVVCTLLTPAKALKCESLSNEILFFVHLLILNFHSQELSLLNHHNDSKDIKFVKSVIKFSQLYVTILLPQEF